MRLIVVILTVAFLSMSVQVYAQKITISVKDAPITEVFKILRNQTGLRFNYFAEQVATIPPITINVISVELDDVLALILKGLPYKFERKRKYIILKTLTPTTNITPDTNSVFNLKGKVLHEDAQAAEGVSVMVVGTNRITSTNSLGEFSFTGLTHPSNLIFTSITTQPLEYRVTDTSPVTIYLKSKVSDLEQVTVEVSTGYQQLSTERANGSFSLIDNNTLNKQVGTNILNRLEGATSGILFDDSKARIDGKKLNFTVRGLSTINGPKDPLIVLDAFPYEGNIANINPNDIESITVLKDAAASSIWGTRAGNGVIVITSKKSKFNQPLKLEVNTTVMLTKQPDLSYAPQMSSADYIDVEQHLFNQGAFNSIINSFNKVALSPALEVFLKKKNGSISSVDSAAQINSLKSIDVRNDYDKYFYQNATTQQYNLSLRAGTSNISYLLSGNFEKSISDLDAPFKKANIHFENSYKPVKNLLVNLSVLYTNSRSASGKPAYNSITVNGRPLPYLSFADGEGQPVAVDKNLKSGYTDTAGGGKLLDWKYYPLTDWQHTTTKTNLDELLSGITIQYQLRKDLSIEAKYQYQKQRVASAKLSDAESYDARNLINTFSQLNRTTGNVTYPVPKGSIYSPSNNSLTSHNFRVQLNYSKNWKNHSLNAIAGSEIRQARSAQETNTVYGYNTDNLTSANVDFVNSYPTFVTGRQQFIPNGLSYLRSVNKFVSYFTNLGYVYKGKYTISASARRDASNVFGVKTNDRWKPLWSVGGGWEISKEKFFHLNFLSLVKLRTTFGYSGNVDLSKYAVTVISNFSTNTYNNYLQSSIIQFANPDLQWEEVSQFNIGLDFITRDNLISGSLEYYHKEGSKLFGPSSIDYTVGVASNTLTKNIADMKGNGIDFSALIHLINREVKWNSTLVFGYNTSKTVKYYVPAAQTASNFVSNGSTINPIIGKPLYSVFSFKWNGLDNLGNPVGSLNGLPSTDYGSIISKVSTADSLVYHGSASPTVFGSIGNSFSYKNWSLSINLLYKAGYYARRGTISFDNLINNGIGHSDFGLRWQKPDDELKTTVPAFVYPNIYGRDQFYQFAEPTVYRADNIRLQYVNLSYLMDKSRLQKSPFSSIEVFFNASNLGVLWKSTKAKIDPDYPPGNFKPSKTVAIGLRAAL